MDVTQIYDYPRIMKLIMTGTNGSNYAHCKPIFQRERNDMNYGYEQAQQGFETLGKNLLINVIFSFAISVIFLLMKEIAWVRQNPVEKIHKDGWISLLYRDVFDLLPNYVLQRNRVKHKSLERGMNFLQMMYYCFFGLTMEEIGERCGVDALQYLQFLRGSIQFQAINSIIVLLSVVPTNFEGTRWKNSSIFTQTTMDNLHFDQWWAFWLHVFVSVVVSVICLTKIRKFSAVLIRYSVSRWCKKTVFLEAVGYKPLTSERIERYFSDAFPAAEIEDIKLVYKYKRFISLHQMLADTVDAMTVCMLIAAQEGRSVYVKRCCWCCLYYCSSPCQKYKVDGLEYYRGKVDRMKKLIAAELSYLPLKVFRTAYVTFTNEYTAYKVRRRRTRDPNIEDDKCFVIRDAPDPSNIIWHNLTRRGSNFTGKTLFINTAVFAIAVFVTTPTIILTGMDQIPTSLQNKEAIFRYFTVLVAWTLSVSVAALVAYSSTLLDFETKSAMNRSIMFKTVTYLTFSVIILPTLGLVSMSAFLLWSFEGQSTLRDWSCLFLPDNGIFFVNYVVTASFVGNFIQVLHVPEIICCIFSSILSKSEVEKSLIRKYYIWDFNYGVQYAHGLLMYILVFFYSSLIPIIAPAGLLYFLTKYVVDKYNICYTYSPSQSCNKVHSLAIQFMMFAVLLKQLGLLVFIRTRQDWGPLSFICLALLLIVGLLWFVSANPCRLEFIPDFIQLPHTIAFKPRPPYAEEQDDEQLQVYLPPELTEVRYTLFPVDKYGNLLPRRDDMIQDISSSELHNEV